MKQIKYIAVHCTATNQDATVSGIQRYWREHNKWKSPGYHYLIKADGEIVNLLDESKSSNGVKGYNSVSVNVSYIGGIDTEGNPKDTRTAEQKASLLRLITELRERYPKAKIQGHCDFPDVKKACPSFDALNEYKHI